MRSPADTLLLVLLPGLLCDAEVWAAQAEALGATVDVQIARYADRDRLEAMAADLLAELPPRPLLLAGHSMGGRVALELVRQAPQRVAGLALLDSGTAPLTPGAAGEAEARGRYELLALARAEGMTAMARRWAQPMVHEAVVGTPCFERIVAMVARHTTERFAAQIEALLHRPDGAPVLRSLPVPLLLLCGREDRWSPPDRHAATQALVPGAQLDIVEHCGHMSPMEQPEAVTRALRSWIDRCTEQGDAPRRT